MMVHNHCSREESSRCASSIFQPDRSNSHACHSHVGAARRPLRTGRRHPEATVITRRTALIGGSIAVAEIHRPLAFAIGIQKETKMDIEIKRNGSRPSQKGPEDWF